MRALRVVGDPGSEVLAGIAHATRLDTLEEVLRAGFHVLEVVVQDEYTHDVVTRVRDMIVVFDTT
jgi:hypothetical protein